eukprot:gene38396-65490_t
MPRGASRALLAAVYPKGERGGEGSVVAPRKGKDPNRREPPAPSPLPTIPYHRSAAAATCGSTDQCDGVYVFGHPDPSYNNKFYLPQQQQWNGRAYYKTALSTASTTSARFLYFDDGNDGGEQKWSLDGRDQSGEVPPGGRDWHDGGANATDVDACTPPAVMTENEDSPRLDLVPGANLSPAEASVTCLQKGPTDQCTSSLDCGDAALARCNVFTSPTVCVPCDQDYHCAISHPDKPRCDNGNCVAAGAAGVVATMAADNTVSIGGDRLPGVCAAHTTIIDCCKYKDADGSPCLPAKNAAVFPIGSHNASVGATADGSDNTQAGREGKWHIFGRYGHDGFRSLACGLAVPDRKSWAQANVSLRGKSVPWMSSSDVDGHGTGCDWSWSSSVGSEPQQQCGSSEQPGTLYFKHAKVKEIQEMLPA